jgi:tellurite methyltransferase
MSESERKKWDARWRERGPLPSPPSILLTALDDLPDQGRALDIAGGNGRHALWLADRGLSVTLLDVSVVALEQAAAAARASDLQLETVCADLECDPLPAGPWELVLSFHYLNRHLWPRFPELLAPGGILVFVQPTRRNLERHERPGVDFLLEEGEAARIASRLEVVRLEEGWSTEGRHEAVLVARRPHPGEVLPTST